MTVILMTATVFQDSGKRTIQAHMGFLPLQETRYFFAFTSILLNSGEYSLNPSASAGSVPLQGYPSGLTRSCGKGLYIHL